MPTQKPSKDSAGDGRGVGSSSPPRQPFTDGTIKILSISCHDMKNVEMQVSQLFSQDKPDPYLKLAIDTWYDETEALMDVNSNCGWDDLIFAIPVSSNIIEDECLRVVAMEYNSRSSHKYVSKGSVPLNSLLDTLDSSRSTELIVRLSDEEDAFAGTVVVHALLERKIDIAKGVSEKLTKGTLQVTRVRVRKTKNVDSKEWKPHVVLKYQNRSMSTSVIDCAAGNIACWKNLYFKVDDITTDILGADLNVDIWNGKSLVGSGRTSLLGTGYTLGEEFECRISLTADNGEVGYQIVTDVILFEGRDITDDDLDMSNISLQPSFTSGVARISSLKLFDVDNTEQSKLNGTLTYGGNSIPINSAEVTGSMAVWDNLNVFFDVNRQVIASQRLELALSSASSGGIVPGLFGKKEAKPFGKNQNVSLVRAVQQFGEEVLLKFPVMDSKGKLACRASLMSEVCVGNDVSGIEVPSVFDGGCLRVFKVVVSGVESKSSATLRFGESQWTLDESNSLVWEHLNIRCQLTRDALLSGTLELELGTIGKGRVPIIKLCPSIGNGCRLLLNICRRNNDPVGTAVVFAAVLRNEVPRTVQPPQLDNFLCDGLLISCVTSRGFKEQAQVEFKIGPAVSDKSVTVRRDSVSDNTNIIIPINCDEIMSNKLLDIVVRGEGGWTGAGNTSLRRLTRNAGTEDTLSVDVFKSSSCELVGRIEIRGKLKEAQSEQTPSVPEKAESATQKDTSVPEKTESAPRKSNSVPEKQKLTPEKTESATQKDKSVPEKTESASEKAKLIPVKEKLATEKTKSASQKDKSEQDESGTMHEKRGFLDGFTKGILRISQIKARDLENLELMPWDKQDPFIKVIAGEEFEDETAYQSNAGKDADWNDLDMVIPVDVEFLRSGKITFEAWEHNTARSHLQIGCGQVSLGHISKIGEAFTVSCPILNDKKKKSGRIEAVVTLEYPPNEVSNTEKAPKTKTDSEMIDASNSDHAANRKNDSKDKNVSNIGEAHNTRNVSNIKGVSEVGKKNAQLPKGFTKGILRISQIKARDLKNLELMPWDKQDPFIKVIAGEEFEDETAYQSNAGKDADWNDLDMVIPVDVEFLRSGKITFEAWEHNTSRSHLQIGCGQVSLEHISKIGEEFTVSCPILNDKKKKSGRIEAVVTLEYPPKDETPSTKHESNMKGVSSVDNTSSAKTSSSAAEVSTGADVGKNGAQLPKGFTKGILRISQIKARDLKNLELMPLDKQDPFIKVIAGEEFEDETAYQSNAGKDADWNDLDMVIPVDVEFLRSGKITFEAWEHNTSRSHLQIGCGQVSLGHISKIGEAFTVSCPILNDKKKKSGRIEAVVTLEYPPKDETPSTKHESNMKGVSSVDNTSSAKTSSSAAEVSTGADVGKNGAQLPKGFTKGILRISQIKARDLKNLELMPLDKQDPFIKVIAGEEFEDETAYQSNAGKDADWNDLDMVIPVDVEFLRSGKITFEAWEHNTSRSHLQIGCGQVSLGHISKIGEAFTVSCPILNDKKKKSGRIEAVVTLEYPPKEDSTDAEVGKNGAQLPNGFTKGILRISQLKARDLKNLELMPLDKQDPFIKVIAGEEFEDETAYQSNAGKDADWNDLDMVIPVDVEFLRSGKITFEAWEHNTSRSHLQIGCGQVSLGHISKIGEAFTVSCPILNDKKKKSGRIEAVVTLEYPPKEDSTDAEVGKNGAQLPKGFTKGILRISQIKARDLKNLELMPLDKQDPFIKVIAGEEFEDETAYQSNAGKDADWNDLDMVIPVDVEFLRSGKITFEAWEHNTSRSHLQIGCGQVSLGHISKIGEEFTVSCPILNDKKKKSGRIEAVVTLEYPPKEDSTDAEVGKNGARLPNGFTKGILRISQIKARDLKNLELMPLDKQDPFIKVIAGLVFEGETKYQSNAGKDADWNDLDMVIPVDVEFLRSGKITFEAWEHNTARSHLQIGCGQVSLGHISKIGEEFTVSCPILNDKKKKSGRIEAVVTLEYPPKEVSSEFDGGLLLINRITAFGVSKSVSPRVKLTLGTWEVKTDAPNIQGEKMVWDSLNFRREISVDDLKTSKVLVALCEEGGNGNEEIVGSGKVKVISAGAKLNDETVLSVDMASANGKAVGRIELCTMVRDGYEPDEDTLQISNGFEFGTLYFKQIKSFDLKNTELFGKQDPFVELKVDEWKGKTYTKQEGGGDVVWNFLDLHCDVTADTLRSKDLEITVWDENKTRKNALIGNAYCRLIKPGAFVGEEVKLAVSLADEKGKYSGRLEIYATLVDEEKEQERNIPESFRMGELRIMRISAYSLKKTELFGESDRFVELSLEDTDLHERTTVLKSAGSDPIWDHLDFYTTVNASIAKVGKIELKVWDQGHIYGKTYIGGGSVGLRRCAASLGDDVELRAKLFDDDDREAGRIVLLASMKEVPPSASDKEISLPESFTSGIVHFNSISAKGLKNKEIIGKQDPYVKLELASWTDRTTTLQNCGSAPAWPCTKHLFCEVDRQILSDYKLRITVYDENENRAHSVLGTGSVSLRPLAPKINREVHLQVNLSDKGVASGYVIIAATLREALETEISDTIPESAVRFAVGSLTVKSVAAKGIIGGDNSIFDSKQDLYVVLELNEWQWSTPYQNNSGPSASWDNLEGVVTEIDGDVAKYQRLAVSVWDKNTCDDELIGKGDVSLRKAGAMVDKDVMMMVPITNKNSERCGVVALELQINESTLNKVYEENDGSSKNGILEINEIRIENLKKSGWFGKQDVLVALSIGTNWTYETDINTTSGTNAIWNCDISHEVAVSQLNRDAIAVDVRDKSKRSVGRGSLTARPLLSKMDQWTVIRGDLFVDKEQCGHIVMNCRFCIGDSSGQGTRMERVREDKADVENILKKKLQEELESERRKMLEMLTSHTSTVGNIETSLKKQLHEELELERKKMVDMLSNHNRKLDETLGRISRRLPDSQGLEQHDLAITELNNVKLPANICEWRASHVQAWISLRMDLPQYLQQFQDASIDGLVLLRHVNDEILSDTLGVTTTLHRMKILEGIESLKAKQVEYENRTKAKNKTDVRPSPKTPPKKRKVVKKKKKNVAQHTWFGDVREQNDLERVKLERIMREKRAEELKAKKKTKSRSEVWKFEYTGGAKPVTDDEELYGPTQSSKTGTALYERTISNLLQTVTISSNTQATMGKYIGAIRQIPLDSVLDEVITITKGAMYDVSDRLIEIERIKSNKEAILDSDLEGLSTLNSANPVSGSLGNFDGHDDDDPPPTYEESDSTEVLPQHLNQTEHSKLDRAALIFESFINLQNNDARWLGSNGKLTRLKFHGGFESILRLKISWPQFDALWNKLDFHRTGELDIEEFREVFGDFSEFESKPSVKRLGGSADSALGNLADIMYDMCNSLRRAGFTVLEMFSSFDRNGSGEVSIHEFCSMVRVILGRHVDKKQIFRSFALMDVDSSRSISCNEILTLVYNVWKFQMKDLAAKLSPLDEVMDAQLISKILKERDDIKAAVKKNFPREWRDLLERTKESYNKGPFYHILQKMNITSTSSTLDCQNNTTCTQQLDQSLPTTPSRPRKGHPSKSGRNELLRYKVNSSRTHIPTRQGAVLTVPSVKSFGQGNLTSEGAALRRLQDTEPSDAKVFTLTSNL